MEKQFQRSLVRIPPNRNGTGFDDSDAKKHPLHQTTQVRIPLKNFYFKTIGEVPLSKGEKCHFSSLFTRELSKAFLVGLLSVNWIKTTNLGPEKKF